MCTIIGNEITDKKDVFAWKVVEQDYDGDVGSYYKIFYWEPKKNNIAYGGAFNPRLDYDFQVFHCFANRKDARSFRKSKGPQKYPKLRIIKLKLYGRIFRGITNGMGRFDGLKAICGTKAYWDGKFHR